MSVRKNKTTTHRRVVDARLLKTLKHVVLFRASVAVLSKLSQSKLKHSKKISLFFMLRVSDGSYVNLQGVLRIENNGIFLSKVDEGETVGEMGVLNDLPVLPTYWRWRKPKFSLFPNSIYRIMKNNQKTAVTIYKKCRGFWEPWSETKTLSWNSSRSWTILSCLTGFGRS